MPDLVATYEQLRAAVLGAPVIAAAGQGTLHRQGMAAWIKAMSTTPPSTLTRPTHRLPVPGAPAASELAVLLASLVVTLTGETAHA